MRFTMLVLTGLVAFPAGLCAQHDPYGAAARESEAYEGAADLQRRLQQSLLGGAADTNANVSSLRQRRETLADQTAIVNNVVSFRKKDELARWVEDAKQRWGAESGPRIRVFNPYEMSSYSRYYDENGNLMVSEVRNSYEYLQQQRADWEQARKRAEQSVDLLEREYAETVEQYGTVQARQSELAAALEQARRRQNDFTGQTPNSVTGGNSGASAPPVPRPAPKPMVLNLAGRTGDGQWTVNGRTSYFTYEFQAGGRVLYRSATENIAGTWTQNGNSVTVRVGGSSESGTLQGNRLVLETVTNGVTGVAVVTFE
jgi:hypothetical protein